MNIHFINPKSLINALSDINCGKKFVGELPSKDFEIRQTETKPLKDFIAPENFPNCCEYHKSLFKIGLDRFSNFPNCCEHHKKLNSAGWFKKSNYSYLPLKLVTTLAHTNHCISQCISNPNWFKEITDYIDYTKGSYGQFPDGYGAPLGLELYLHNLEKQIGAYKEMPKSKREKILGFIKKYSVSVKSVELTDLNILIGTYKKWVKEFPFELSFLNHLKPHFENQMPILEGAGETNIYTGLTAFKVKTKESLIDFLVSTTENIITKINTLWLYEQGLITDAAKLKLELIIESRKMKLKEGYSNSSPDENHRYIKMLKSWFKDEKEFIDEVSPLLQPTPSSQIERKEKKIKAPIIALFCFFCNQSGLLPRDETEIVKDYCKKVCQQFGLIYSDRVRQGYSTSNSKSNTRKLIEQILPNIDEKSRAVIKTYLQSKPPTKQNLYA